MKGSILVAIASIFILYGCTSLKLMQGNQAAIYDYAEGHGGFIPVHYNYAMIHRVDGKLVGLHENPIFVEAGKRKLTLVKGSCVAPIMIVACDFQRKSYSEIEYEFEGGKKYMLTKAGEIVKK